MSVQGEIRQYILNDIGWSGDPEALTGELNLIDHHVLDSLAVVELATVVEQRFGVKVTASELVYKNFYCLEAIAAFVDAKRAPVS